MGNVQITEQQILKSQQLKKEKTRTVRQQQVYKDAQNLFYVMAQMRKNCPVKCRAVLDPSYSECMHLLVSLSLAYADAGARVPQLTLAAAHLDALHTALGMLRSLGGISKDDYKKARSLATSCTQQTMAWRASSLARLAQGSNAV